MGLSIFEAWNKSIFSFGSTQRNYSVSVLKKPKKTGPVGLSAIKNFAIFSSGQFYDI